MTGGLLGQAFVYLGAAVVAVPIAKRLGLGSVLGYLIAGVAIGPAVLGLVGQGEDVMHFAEFGVVLMLFLIGLELQPSLLWRLRTPILGMGGLQVGLTILAVAAAAVLLGRAWNEALAIGMVLALSSTAIVLQTLDERGASETAGGKSAFAVLLFQDIAVIPMLAVMPLLAVGVAPKVGHHEQTWVETLPAGLQTAVVLGAVVSIVVAGRYLLEPAFRYIAKTRLREVFVAAALFLVIGIALLMTQVGLSPALGTFIAGVVLANSDYRHELESDIEPFKGLLLGLFFIAVGASIDFDLIFSRPLDVAGLVAALMIGKLVILLGLGRAFGLSIDQYLLFGFALAQGGEFAFVLFSFAAQSGVLPDELTALLVAAVAVSMGLTPLAMLAFERLIAPRVGTRQAVDRAYDDMDEDRPVIIAGYGRFGQIVGRLLATQGVHATVLEYDSDQVDLLRRFGNKVFYGDAARYDLLHAAGADKARLIVLAIDEPERLLSMVHTVKKHFPHLEIVARARGRVPAYELMDAGVQHVFRETFDSALAAGAQTLRQLGFRGHRAHRAAQAFRRHDEALVREVAKTRHDAADLVQLVRQRTAEVERVLEDDLASEHTKDGDGAFDVEALRDPTA